MSVMIRYRQLVGTARIKRVSVPNGDHRAPGTHHSHGRVSTSPTKTFTEAPMTARIKSVCDWRPSFRRLSCFAAFGYHCPLGRVHGTAF